MSDDDDKTHLRIAHLDVPPSEMQCAIAEYRKSLPHLIDYNRLQAQLWHKKYQALVGEGFTPSEALQLCCK